MKEYNAYGKASLRAVTTQESLPYEAYVPCDFGIRIYQNRDRFEQEIRELSKQDRQYLTELPWPPAVVWHAADERMMRIMEGIGTMKPENEAEKRRQPER